jgi:hypothetical protein
LLALDRLRRSALNIRVHGRKHRIPEDNDVDRQPAEYLAGPSFDIQNAEKNVAWLDLLVPTADRKSVGALERTLGAVRQAQFRGAGHLGRRANGLANFASAPAQGCTRLDQRSTNHALLVRNESKEEMLGPDLAVPQTPSLLLGPGDRHTRPITESVQHGVTLDPSWLIGRAPTLH